MGEKSRELMTTGGGGGRGAGGSSVRELAPEVTSRLRHRRKQASGEDRSVFPSLVQEMGCAGFFSQVEVEMRDRKHSLYLVILLSH